MTDVDSAIAPTVRQRWRAGRWVISALVLITAVAALTTSLTAARPGGRMDPAATSPEGAHALIALLRDHGVDVVVAGDIGAVERAAQPDTLVITVQTNHLVDDGVDTGPVLAQSAVPVEPGDTVDALHERIKIEERRLLVGTVAALARDGATVSGREVTIP